ncbi:MAG: hypothetical protein H0V26_01340 [Solirubrobacterales bacterium]|nr:hypothetical protein [Solirubrobacterales bacterium]
MGAEVQTEHGATLPADEPSPEDSVVEASSAGAFDEALAVLAPIERRVLELSTAWEASTSWGRLASPRSYGCRFRRPAPSRRPRSAS